jgi:oligopeptide transport system permease protein
MASRLIQGGRISLLIALAASVISLGIGVTWGGIAGYAGGAVDAVMMRVVDVLYGVPTILVVIMLMVYLDQGIQNIYLAIGLTYWLNMARLTRAQVMALRNRDFVEAARSLGAGGGRILVRHIMPNAMGIILVSLTLFIPEAIFMEAFLSYIGLGVPAPDASWGTLAADGARNLRAAPYLMLYPAAVICTTMLAFNIAGDRVAGRGQK